jgi:hypothetical protein
MAAAFSGCQKESLIANPLEIDEISTNPTIGSTRVPLVQINGNFEKRCDGKLSVCVDEIWVLNWQIYDRNVVVSYQGNGSSQQFLFLLSNTADISGLSFDVPSGGYTISSEVATALGYSNIKLTQGNYSWNPNLGTIGGYAINAVFTP